MIDEPDLGDGWRVWNAGDDGIVLVYRPDVFDGATYPAACLPTIYVTRGYRDRRPGRDRTRRPDTPWTVTLYLEPDVGCDPDAYDSQTAAVDAAVELTRRFADGDVDYRGLYQIPRDDYFEKLDELTG